MASVKVTSKEEIVGQVAVYETTYEFSSFDDFNKWELNKQQALVSNINNTFSLSVPEDTDEDPLKDNISSIMEAVVKKKPTLN